MNEKLDYGFLAISALAGLLFSFLGEFIYVLGLAQGSRIVIITIYLAAYVIIMGTVICIKAAKSKTYVDFSKVLRVALLLTLGFLVLTVGFEYLYERQVSLSTLNTDEIQYIFVVDDSGSMGSNDPDDLRYDALTEIITSMPSTDEFAVYVFSEEYECTTELGSINSADYEFQPTSEYLGASTMLYSVLSHINSEIQASDTDKHTKIVVLTDGDPSDYSSLMYSSNITKFVTNNISISSLRFGDVDTGVLGTLATNTGGIYLYCDDIAELVENLDIVVSGDLSVIPVNRDLLGYRMDSTADSVLYAVLRILFLGILGLLWSIIKVVLLGEIKYNQVTAVLFSAVWCLLGAVLCEGLLIIFELPDITVRAIVCILWAITLIPNFKEAAPTHHDNNDLGTHFGSGANSFHNVDQTTGGGVFKS